GARRLLLQLLLPLLWRLRGGRILGRTADIAAQSLQRPTDCLPVGAARRWRACPGALVVAPHLVLQAGHRVRVIDTRRQIILLRVLDVVPGVEAGGVTGAEKATEPVSHCPPPSDCAIRPSLQPHRQGGSSAGAARAPPAPSARDRRHTVLD